MSNVSMKTQSEQINVYNEGPECILARRYQALLWVMQAQSDGMTTKSLIKRFSLSIFPQIFMLISSYYKQQNKSMLAKFTQSAFKTSLIKIIQAIDRKEEMIRTIMEIFTKSLSWLEQRYDKQSIRDAAQRIKIKGKHNEQNCAWIYVIQGCFWIDQIAYLPNEFITQQPNQTVIITFQQNSTYAILNFVDLQYIKDSFSQRSNKRLIKFIRRNIFYSYFLQDQQLKQFTKLIIIYDMPYKAILNWNYQRQSNQIAIICKGALSIQYKQKRNLKITELTKGMMIMNTNQSQYKEQAIIKLNKQTLQYASNFKYVSISDETRLLIFSSNIFLQSPFKENASFFGKIKAQYDKYYQILKGLILIDEENRLYRRKQSIKKQLKQQRCTKQKVIYDSSIRMKTNLSPDTPKVSSSLSIYGSSTSLNINNLSQSIASLQSSKQSKNLRLQTLTIPFCKNIHVHNSWIQSINKKQPKYTKSFSVLHNTGHYHSQRQKRNNYLQKQSKQQHDTNFFVPQQFIKKNLKMKLQCMIPKIKHIDISLKYQPQKNVSTRLKRLQSEIQQRRIVKLDRLKRKKIFIRDKF